ncbi:hypothetical protein OQZ33_04460 [Pedobacter sp. MC2016-05]|uniref:hypothetical protein n=1 Tax=Pedobacter sp. MC2016-05 TaxID=2994474 RepID=UPI002245EBA6|nr:hypothetical protein [Pedobacter sp. MC2016-05]MCX2473579.1 hypothetical protein [Pedobacter sp. MC2016-05]
MGESKIGKVGLTPKGPWLNSVEYSRLDLVQYLGSSYVAVSINAIPVGTLPTDAAYFKLHAAKGDQGQQGLPAVQGIATPSGVPAGTRFAGETWLIQTSNYGNTFVNFGNQLVPSKVGEQYVSNARFVWSGTAWILNRELVDAPAGTDFAKKTEVTAIPAIKDGIKNFQRITLNRVAGTTNPATGGDIVNGAYIKAEYIIIDADRDGLYYTGVMLASSASPISYYTSAGAFISSEAVTSSFKHYTRYKLTVPINAYKIVVSGIITHSSTPNIAYPLLLEKAIYIGVSDKVAVMNTKSKNSSIYTKTIDPKANRLPGNVSRKGYRQWFKLIDKQAISGFSVPIARDASSTALLFTDGIIVTFVTSRGHSFTYDIPFSEVVKYNTLITQNIDDYDYWISLNDILIFDVDDIIQISWSCKAANDKIGRTSKLILNGIEPDSSWAKNGFAFVLDLDTGNDAVDYMTQMVANSGILLGATLGVVTSSTISKALPPFISPRRVYTVCNDVIPAEFGFNRNTSAAIYLDQFFNAISQEPTFRFSNGSNRLTVNSPMNAGEDRIMTYNEGFSVLKKNFTDRIQGAGYIGSDFTFQHISTLNSATKNGLPRVLVIGDSILSGATPPTLPNDLRDGRAQLVAKELFQMDIIDNGNKANEYGAIFLGTQLASRTFTYKNNTVTNKVGFEGYAGMRTDQMFIGPFSDGLGTTINNFAITNWLNKYRTMDNAGIRLASDSPIKGSLVSNVNDYDVTVPTHIIFTLANNDADTFDHLGTYKALIARIKAEYATNGWGVVNFGIAFPSSGGTIFPSIYPNLTKESYAWNSFYGDGGRKPKIWKFTQDWLNDLINEDTERIFQIPFYFTQNPDSTAQRSVPTPTGDNIKIPYGGFLPRVHPDATAHMNYAYQIYAWLKYTLTL